MNSMIHTQKVFDQLAEILESKIVEGVYSVGERLPSERQLASDYQISRASVRSALHTLCARNLVYARQGGGYYVSDSLHQDFLSPWQDLLSRHDYVEQDVLTFRRGFEGLMASLAAIHATEKDLERIHYWLLRMDEPEKKDLERQSKADVNFHQAIAEATHNVLFSHLSSSLLTMLDQHTQKNLANMFSVKDHREKLRQQHHRIYQAIACHQTELACQYAHEHIDYVAQTLSNNRQYETRTKRAEALAQKDRLQKKTKKKTPYSSI